VASVCLSPNGLETWWAEQPPAALLVATTGGIVRLERPDGARLWSQSSCALSELHIGSLLRTPCGAALFAGVHGSGLYRSLDGGRSWRPAMRGLDHTHVFCLACVDDGTGVVIYAGTEPVHLYRSRDLGDTWEELPALRSVPGREQWNFPAPPHVAHVKHIAFDPRDSRRMFVCVEQGALLRSDDAGVSFRELHFQDRTFRLNKDAHRIVFNPVHADEMCLVGGEGISRSLDGGESWQRLTTAAMRIRYPDYLCYAPDEPGVLFVAGGGTTPDVWRETGEASGALARSCDDGRTWAQVGGGLPSRLAGNMEAMSLVRWPGGYGFFAGTTDGEIYYSGDKGRNWTSIAKDLPPVSKCIHHRNLSAGRERKVQVTMAALQAMRF
jgi:photosystem II stability/assembly factor-like uncharacterized protein